jgi:sugar/nucleoside kinase (ribokinase family)
VTIGHVTVDVLAADGARRPGGTAFYSGLQAARLGLRTLVITKGVPRELDELLRPYRHEFELRVLEAEQTTTLHTAQIDGVRVQRVLAWAGPIDEPVEVDTSILQLAPVARETPSGWVGDADFVGITPQGLTRAWDAHGEISLRPPEPEHVPERCDALVISAAERASCERLLAAATASGATVAVTDGAHPTTLIMPDGTIEQAPVAGSGRPRDDIGAGDVFAAAFFIALRDGRTPAAAAAYASTAAAIRIEGDGPSAVADGPAIERRLAGR